MHQFLETCNSGGICMAGFKTHLTGGILSGASISLVGVFAKGLTITQAGALFVVGSVAGLLPDLDSDTGKPLSLLFQLISLLIPSMLFFRVAQYAGNSPEFLICYFAISYLLINYVICSIIKKMTVHRGMMHSIPFALLCGGLGYLLFIPSGKQVALLAGICVLSGCLVHLVLDELHSFTLKYGFIPTLKKSSGTALKLKSDSLVTTLVYYSLLAFVILGILLTLAS